MKHQRLAAEGIGSLLLAATVIGSGIMAPLPTPRFEADRVGEFAFLAFASRSSAGAAMASNANL
jgi:hypothetical protein